MKILVMLAAIYALIHFFMGLIHLWRKQTVWVEFHGMHFVFSAFLCIVLLMVMVTIRNGL